MSETWEPVSVVRAGEYAFTESLDPSIPNQPHIKPPYSIGTAVKFLSDVEITSPERPEGDLRGLPGNECLIGGTVLIGPDGGEDWHEHMDYYDIALYVEAGELEVGIKAADGAQSLHTCRAGDFVRIPPHAVHSWRNRTQQETKLVWFAHFHDRQKG